MAEGAGTGWSQIGKEKEKEQIVLDFSSVEEEIKREQERAKSTSGSVVCAGFVGRDGTGKTGAALDCRSEEDKKKGLKVFLIDIEGGAFADKKAFYEDDPNVIVLCPTVLKPDGSGEDLVATYKKIQLYIAYAKELEEKGELKAIIFDGVDTFLKNCELQMKSQYLHLDIDKRPKLFDWGIRATLYNSILLQLKIFRCMVIFITHLKDKQELVNNNLIVTGEIEDWEKRTPNLLVQKVYFYDRKVSDKKSELIAIVKKSKTDLSIKDKVYTIAEVEKGKDGKRVANWKGLGEFYKDLGEW